MDSNYSAEDAAKELDKIIAKDGKLTSRKRKASKVARLKAIIKSPSFNVALQNCEDPLLIGSFFQIYQILDDK